MKTKLSELRKLLKTATMNVNFRGGFGYSATLQIEYTPVGYTFRHVLIRIIGHCSGINEYLKEEPNCFVDLPGQSGFYGAHAPTEVSLVSSLSDAQCPVTAQNLFDLVRGVIQDKNLHFVSPECQLTQIWSALAILGVEPGPRTVNSMPYLDWYRLNKLARCVNCSAKIQGTKASGGDHTCAVCEAKSSALVVAV